MNVNLIKKLFEYKPKNEYNFSLPNNPQNMQISKEDENKKIFKSLDINVEYIKTKYNLLINSDIVCRNFTLNARGKQYKAAILYIDGMVDTNLLNDFILKPLMLRNENNLFEGNQNKVVSEAISNNITVKKVKKFDLANYIESCLVPQNSVVQYDTFSKIFSGVNSGNCALFVDTIEIAFDIDVKGFKQRSISKPENEIVIKGSHEAFVENIRTNTSKIW